MCIGLQLTVSPVLNQIQEHYPHVDRSMIQMLVTAPALLSALVSVICGWLVTKVSMKKLLLLAAGIAGVTGFIPFLYDSFGLLFFSRVLLGVAIGLSSTLNTAVVVEHFHGGERVSAMGMQAATIGFGYLFATTLGGIIGNFGFQYTYFIHIIGFVSLFFIWRLLPDTGRKRVGKAEGIKMNAKVYRLLGLGFLEVIFLFVFSTNIAMHLSGKLAGNSSVAGILIGVFSGIQIVAGLFLGQVVKYAKQHTMALAMLSLSMGCFIILLKPDSFLPLLLGAALCGISQGIFVPQIIFEATSAVKPVAAAMASALLTVSFCLSQLASPYVFNNVSRLVWGSTTTAHVYMLAAVGMLFISLLLFIARIRKRQ
ncbi:MAG TPA: MFS transporter [Clostridiales bacterium]|nr:MFS transporter [Clostridiales bacterium]